MPCFFAKSIPFNVKILFAVFNSVILSGINFIEVRSLKKVRRRMAVILISLLFLTVLFIASFNQLLPIVNARAIQYSRSYATEVINLGIKSVLEEEVSDVVRVAYDGNMSVVSLSTDTVALNRIKTEAALRILEILSEEGRGTLNIPIGNLSGMYLLSGRGFPLSIRLIPTDSVLVETESSFTEAGINQSRHRISLRVTLRLGVIILGRHNAVEVCDSTVISDTVIVGRVPDSYTDIEKIDDETLGDIVDFKAG